jgi:hypothetical protein
MNGERIDGYESARMKNSTIFRHEMKYLISSGQVQMLKSRLNTLIPIDMHVGDNGFYNIRSLYFDDYYNRCYYENENGTDPREKFRIRIYNHSPERIALECKRKERGKTLKDSCSLTKEQCEQLIRNEYIRDIATQPNVLKKLTMEMMTRQLRPRVIVEYDRIPYVYASGNVRVTLDINVASSFQIDGFLEGDISKRPIMPMGLHLLEVKWDEYLPDVIYRALQLESLQQTAYSKYYLCRKYCER